MELNRSTFSPLVNEFHTNSEDGADTFEELDLGDRSDADTISGNGLASDGNRQVHENMTKRSVYAPGTSSLYKAAYNFINSIIGAGIIGIPYAFGECGMLGGLLLLIFVAWLVSQSVQMLIQCGIKSNKLDYEELANHLLGKKGYYATIASMFLFAFGAQVAYLVIIGDTIPALTGANRELVISLVSALLILPLSLLKDMSLLSYTSLAAITADVLIVLLVVLTAPASAKSQNIHPSLQFETMSLFSPRLFAGIGTLSFAFVCMHNSFIVYRSLQERTQDNWNLVAKGSVSVCFVLAAIFGVSGYLAFGDQIKGDILNNFIVEREPIDWARGFLACCMIFVYPMEMFVTRHCLVSILNEIKNRSRNTGDSEDGTELIRNSSTHSKNSNIFPENGKSTCVQFDEKRGEKELLSVCVTDDEAEGDKGEIEEIVQFPHQVNPSKSQQSGSLHTVPGSSEDLDHSNISTDHTQVSEYRRLAIQSVHNEMLNVSAFFRNPENRQHVAVTLCLWSSTTLLALVFDDLGLVLSLTGAVAASCLGYILPGLLYIMTYKVDFDSAWSSAFDKESPHFKSTLGEKVWCFQRFYKALLLIVFGSLAAVLGCITVISGR